MANNEQETFWSDKVAAELKSRGNKHVISTGITPSGEIHVGHLREVVTAHAVYLSLKDLGLEADFHYVADNQDPLRKVYDFLDANKFGEYVGHPIGKIPPPSGDAASYADHFVQPFLAALGKLGMHPRVVRSDEFYLKDEFIDVIVVALEKRDEIAAILHEHTGKQIDASWSPFNPICEQCNRIDTAMVVGFNSEEKTVSYDCRGENGCGHKGERPIKGGGKLTWRVDWPARWKVLGVTMEPFGKDHGTRGGSYDTGAVICRQVFNHEPPYPVTYEWIGLKGAGEMSSSKGNVISIDEMTKVVPGDILRYFVLRSKPSKRLTFDPSLPLLSLVDEFESADRSGSRPVALSKVSDSDALGVPFKHLVTLVQICGDDLEKVKERLVTTGYDVPNDKLLASWTQFAKSWLERFAPEDVKFELQETLPSCASDLSKEQIAVLRELKDNLKDGMSAEEIHKLVYQIKEDMNLKPAEVFQAVYMVLLGKLRGPRVGSFLAALDLQWVRKRFSEV